MFSVYPFRLWWLREYIYIPCLIIIIKSEVWTITHCLVLGHETMVSTVCLSIFLCIRIPITNLRQSHDHLHTAYTGKRASLYWDGPQLLTLSTWHRYLHQQCTVLAIQFFAYLHNMWTEIGYICLIQCPILKQSIFWKNLS